MSIFNLKKGKSEVSVSFINDDNLMDVIEDFDVAAEKIENYFLGDAEEFMVYWDYKKSQSYKEYLFPIYSFFKDNLDFLISGLDDFEGSKINSFMDFYDKWEEKIKEINESYVEKEIERNDDFFKSLNLQLGKELNHDQKVAIVTDEDATQIIASAGTGKTTTLISKVKYLIECKNVEPHKILVLSYGRDSVDDLKERLADLGIENDEYAVEDNVRTTTFHNLGKSFISHRGLVSRGATTENSGAGNFFQIKLYDIVLNYLTKKVSDDLSFLHQLQQDFYEDFKNGTEYRAKPKAVEKEVYYEEEMHNKEFDTLSDDDEPVRSFVDLQIADFLARNNIRFSYFQRAYGQEYGLGKILFVEFYLPDHDIFIENFCVDRTGDVPWLDDDKAEEYIRQMNFKKDFCARNNRKLITVNALINKNFLLDLERKLRLEGVRLEPLKSFQIQNVAKKNHFLQKITDSRSKKTQVFRRNMVSFTENFKLRNYSMDCFEAFKDEAKNDRELNFLNLMEHFFNDYYNIFMESNRFLDFQDMVNKAIGSVHGSDFDYILVDEYQDITRNRLDLLKAVKEDSNAKIIVVGDDWQSIYGFQGCDYRFIVNFKKYFPHAARCDLHRTYRCTNQLITVAGDFVRDDRLLDKSLYSEKILSDTPIRLVLNQDSEVPEKKVVYDILQEISKKERNSSVMILSRFKGSYSKVRTYLNQQNAESRLGLEISYNTMHGAKGLEADNIILVDVNNSDPYGVPSKVKDDEVLRFVSFNDDESKFFDERRLFYVSLTRSKNNVYISADYGNESKYVSELNKDYVATFLHAPDNGDEYDNFKCLKPIKEHDFSSDSSCEDLQHDLVVAGDDSASVGGNSGVEEVIDDLQYDDLGSEEELVLKDQENLSEQYDSSNDHDSDEGNVDSDIVLENDDEEDSKSLEHYDEQILNHTPKKETPIDEADKKIFELVNDEYKIKICPNCKRFIADDEDICPECDYDFEDELDDDLVKCPNCFHIVSKDYDFCPNCNQDLKKEDDSLAFKKRVFDYCCNLIVFGDSKEDAFDKVSNDLDVGLSKISEWYMYYEWEEIIREEKNKVIKIACEYYRQNIDQGISREDVFCELKEMYCVNDEILNVWFSDLND
ncbi:UvrD-helicase domain-containing protein [Methanobrevibacter ruminantium]|uniref:UvrD-helicase domain-containing protein n=1 Tax=Methanobrevibacter ruminantium TaxID=83816 RepID=UPI002D7F2E39|nr:UvrD-helicase domain-containing protein [Methanobrevibacter ruminantium]